MCKQTIMIYVYILGLLLVSFACSSSRSSRGNGSNDQEDSEADSSSKSSGRDDDFELSGGASSSSSVGGKDIGTDSDTNVGGIGTRESGYPPQTTIDGRPCEGPCNDNGPRAESLPPPRCPEVEPSIGDPCDDFDSGLRCGYGDSPTAWCRSIYECNGTWQVPTDKLLWICRTATDCPTTPPAWNAECIVGAAGSKVPCTYEDENLACYCYNVRGTEGLPGIWMCYGPPRSLDCPKELPNIGEGCYPNGIQCQYTLDPCHAPSHAVVFCFDGEWEEGRLKELCPVTI